MNLVKTYGNTIKKNINKPKLVLKLIILGLSYAYGITSVMPNKKIAKPFRYLNRIGLKFVLEALKYPEKSAWVTLLAPSEILHAMDIYPLFIEAFSSFLSGMECEEVFIDYAERAGLSETLCSYHKAFLGAGEAGILPKPKFALTTSLICDGNLNTFRYLAQKYKLPYYCLDVPYYYSKETEDYVVGQLKEAVKMIEEVMGKKLDEEKLKQVLKREQETKNYLKKYLTQLKIKYIPTTIGLQMFMLFTSQVFIGRKETYKFYKMLAAEIEKCPEAEGLRIFWVHLLPFYHRTLQEYFNLNSRYQILDCDLNYAYWDELDYEQPYKALARKMLLNKYNGSFEKRISHISNLIDYLKPDGIINFCHWGCKQSSGGTMLLKQEMANKGIPFLVLDGDGIDKRNSHDGQIRTRLEAFMEILEKNKVI